MSDARPVWLTQAQVRIIGLSWVDHAWDTAPADPAEAVYEATAPIEAGEGRAITRRVLRALGMPDA